MTTPEDVSPAPVNGRTIAALVKSGERTTKRVEAIDGQVHQLADDLARIAALVVEGNRAARAAGPTTARPSPSGSTGVRSWLRSSDVDQAITDLAELIPWLDEVYLRYPDALLSACWMWHPHIVEELWWLSQAHADAFGEETGTWLKVGDWHERQRPQVTKRVREVLAKCDLSLHSEPEPTRSAPLVDHAGTIAEHWVHDRSRPVPSVEQLAEAKALNRQTPTRSRR